MGLYGHEVRQEQELVCRIFVNERQTALNAQKVANRQNIMQNIHIMFFILQIIFWPAPS